MSTISLPLMLTSAGLAYPAGLVPLNQAIRPVARSRAVPVDPAFRITRSCQIKGEPANPHRFDRMPSSHKLCSQTLDPVAAARQSTVPHLLIVMTFPSSTVGV